MERLAHRHILKLIGTYTYKPRNELYLLLYPVAVCDLSKFLEDIDDLRIGACPDEEDAFKRLHALGLKHIGAIEDLRLLRAGPLPSTNDPRTATAVGFLQQILGCITEALMYVHDQDVRHRDLKPKNILLSPGRVYLADFGIARDVRDFEDTMTNGRCGTLAWIPKEVQEEDDYRLSKADVWSLGCIFLNIATIIYGQTMEEFDNIMKEEAWNVKLDLLPSYLQDLRKKARAANLENHDEPTFNVKHVMELINSMLDSDPEKRPSVKQVNERLLELGGLDQIYHLPCCHKKNEVLSEAISKSLELL